MPRAPGQIDESKTEALLDAASALISEHGATVSMEAIARRAGVSKQTLYNRFPSRVAIARALAARRADALTLTLKSGDDPETVLIAYATGLLEKIILDESTTALRNVALIAPQAPGLAAAVYEAGPAEGLRRLSDWLAEQTRAGRLNTPNPDEAAEMFTGLVLGHAHLRSMLNVPQIDDERRAHRAREAARIFVTAYAPTLDQAR